MNRDMRRLAILLMITSSVVISFSGLIVRMLDVGPLVMNFYRAAFLMGAVVTLLFVRYRAAAVVRVIGVGWPGVAAGVMLAGAGVLNDGGACSRAGFSVWIRPGSNRAGAG